MTIMRGMTSLAEREREVMQRRTFLASLAAMAGGVSVGRSVVVADPAPQIRYELFCGPAWSRYTISTPFSIGDATYATDSRVLITHVGEVDAVGEEFSVPPVDRLWWDEFDRAQWKRLRADNPRVHASWGMCPNCMGMTCSSCSDGYVTAAATDELIDGMPFQVAYLHRIRTLPGDLEYRVLSDATDAYGGGAHALAFRWGDGGKGFLMGVER